MASSEQPARKKRATESSIDFRLCLVCEGNKFTNIKGDHQLEHLRQPELESYQQLVDCIKIGFSTKTLSMFVCIKNWVAHLEKNRTTNMQCGTNRVMAKQHTNNTLRDTKLDMTKRFHPKSQVYCHAAKSAVALPCPKHLTPQTRQPVHLPAH